jgi:uncharacterized protein
MIKRILEEKLRLLIGKFPVVSVTGPRQSGKTTLIRSTFPDYLYKSLEEPDTLLFAKTDPRKFLALSKTMIIDEVQRVPEIFSYIQTITDISGLSGQFIISGSQSFLLNQHISQSLAGRVAILNLLPLSHAELLNHKFHFDTYEQLIFQGFYPRLYDKQIEPTDFYPGYIQTYLERDLRLLQNIHDLSLFVRFLKLCAARTGQLLNMSSLANDCGISVNTAKAWISLLETSYIIFLLQPHFKNFNKRLVKMPKMYFFDTGLASSLLEIQSAGQLTTHYIKGALFENFIISEIIKQRFSRGLRSNCFFWRDSKGNEIDCIIENADRLLAVEIKSGSTFSSVFFKNLNYWNSISGNTAGDSFLIYGGDTIRETRDGKLLSWKSFLSEIQSD